MAPSRRKGGGKAAAAAAARRQWKVGDLVLAKVKGFPAWPATVSEPEKWGYSADWKKVLVYFFGTQQIAFCNPADVEPFTEEKKQSLLVKRQGRGADFVRAVQEIIESYEKSKEQDQVDSNSGDEVTLANGRNSPQANHLGLKDRTGAPGDLDLQSKHTSSPSRGAPSPPAGDVLTERQLDLEKVLEQPTDSLIVKETPELATYTSRRRSGGLRYQSNQRKVSSVRRSRTSARVESSRFQNFMTQLNDVGKSAGDMSANVMRDGYVKRNKQARKSPDASECDDVDSSVFVSNGSIEDNGSEIVTVESDALSLNEGSTVDSGSKVERSETVFECSEGDAEFSKGLDFQLKAVVLKKKRKPNRKRVTNDAADPTAAMDTDADLEMGNQTSQISHNISRSFDERHSKEDGDEHLPLLKRARVRMSKPSSAEELKRSSSAEKLNRSSSAEELKSSSSMDELKCSAFALELKSSSSAEELKSSTAADEIKCFSQPEEKYSVDDNANVVQQDSLTASPDEGRAGSDHSPEKRTLNTSSPAKGCTQTSENRPQLWRGGTKNQLFACSVDGEAVLPPSKRLHRALEAMSANAAENQPCIGSAAMNSSIKGFLADSSWTCSEKNMETGEANELGLQKLNSPGNGPVGMFSTLNPVVLEESVKASEETIISDQSIKSQIPESSEDISRLLNSEVGQDQTGSSSQVVETMVQSQNAEQHSPSTDRGQASFKCNQGSIDEIFPSKDETATEYLQLSNFRAEIVDKGIDTVDHTELSLDAVSGADVSARISLIDGAERLPYTAEGTCLENTEHLKSQMGDNPQTNCMREDAEVKHEDGPKHSVGVSESAGGDKDAVNLCSSTNRVDSSAQGSPANTSLCHLPTSESGSLVQNNSYSSPTMQHNKSSVAPVANEDSKVDLPVTEKPKSNGKSSSYSEAHTALNSFEAVLGALTRTKESIGRATRIAIDCAKFGVSSKALEILARCLEVEPNLHKRVDLFFLVDSITQCSRGLKGEVGGIYPPAIQAMLPRFLSAAAPPGTIAQENRRQCLKVLRLWLERRILPETVVRHHIRELDSLTCSSSVGAHSRRSARTERALDDPIREMEGMLVDEYGSNSSFQLPGFCMPRMLKEEDDEGSDSDGGSFEAVTPEHISATPEERDAAPAVEKHRHILEDVDGELEMEDVAPSCDIELSAMNSVAGVNSSQSSHDLVLPFAPLPHDMPQSSPPLPSSPPPPPPPPPPLPPHPHPCIMSDPYSTAGGMHNDLHQSASQQSVAAQKINSTMPSEAVNYSVGECRDHQMAMQMSDSSSSFSSYHTSTNNIRHSEDSRFHHKPYAPRPPHVPSSNQFSYIQAGQSMKSRREAPPPPHSHRFHPLPNFDGGNYYNNHDRMPLSPYDHRHRESWRFPAPFSGPRYPEKVNDSYGSGSYGGPPCDPPRLSNQGWGHPPPPMNHRNSFPGRPPSGGAVPVGRGMWRPR